jgi:hypothetical protein
MSGIFPEELYDLILAYTDTPTRASFCATSHLGSRVAWPHLYNGVVDLAQYAPGGGQRFRRLQALCRTFLEHRKRAQAVHELRLTIDNDTVRSYDASICSDPSWLDASLAVERLRIAMRLPAIIYEPVTGALFNSLGVCEEALIALLLLLCRKLHTLVLHGRLQVLHKLELLPEIIENAKLAKQLVKAGAGILDILDDHSTAWPPYKQSRHACGIYSVSSLRLIDQSPACLAPYQGVTADSVTSILTLPGLRQLKLDSLHPSLSCSSTWSVKTKIRSLTLHGFAGGADDLKQLLASCKHLRDLEVLFSSRQTLHGRTDWMDIYRALTTYCLKLERMVFGYDTHASVKGVPETLGDIDVKMADEIEDEEGDDAQPRSLRAPLTHDITMHTLIPSLIHISMPVDAFVASWRGELTPFHQVSDAGSDDGSTTTDGGNGEPATTALNSDFTVSIDEQTSQALQSLTLFSARDEDVEHDLAFLQSALSGELKEMTVLWDERASAHRRISTGDLMEPEPASNASMIKSEE